MDYVEEQKGEIEALESIYYGDLQSKLSPTHPPILTSRLVLATEPLHKFSVPIKSEEYDPEIENTGLSCDLVFTYTPKYPEESPEISIENSENFEDPYETELLDFLREQVQENLGMVMIFTLVSSAQEWLNVRFEEVKKTRDEETARKLKEEEEAERVIVIINLVWLMKILGGVEAVRRHAGHRWNVPEVESEVRGRNGYNKKAWN